MEEMSKKKNSIFIGLTIRYPPEGDPDNYHWLMWIVGEDLRKGTCVHATNQSGPFVFQQKFWNASESQTLSSLVKIGSLGTYTVDDVLSLLKEIPMFSPAGTEDEKVVFSCRIWVREAVRVLNNAGVIVCGDVNALQEECLADADNNRDMVEQGEGKPAFIVSKVSR